MTKADIAALRLYNQRLSRPDLETPADVVRWLGAVQAQDFAGALYAIGLRMPSATEAMVEHAIADKTIVRSWPMRGTIHLMPAEDAGWMIRLLASRYNVKAAPNYRKAGLTAGTLAQAGKVLASALQGGRLLTRSEIYTALGAAGIKTGKLETEQRGLHILGYWARQGLICITPRRGRQQTFGLLNEWVPRGRELSGNAALGEIASRYFTSHGPATIKDFAWWSGMTLAEAKRALQQVEHKFENQMVDDVVYWSPPRPRDARRDMRNAFLLPPFDEFTVAYADRSAVIDPAMMQGAQHGIGPNIVIGGRVVGTWNRKLKKDNVCISMRLFHAVNAARKKSLSAGARRYGAYLGLEAVVTIVETF